MIALDIGGTKTSVFFSEKEHLIEFEKKYEEKIREVNKKQKFCIVPTFFRESREAFDEFFSFLRSLDGEIISTFPGIIRMEKVEGKWKFRLYSKRFPFLIGQYVNVSFAVNDVYAFAYHHAKKFFRDVYNRTKTLLVIQIGTGVNAIPLNYYDYKELLFLNKIIEAGHMILRQGNEECFCGRRGCAELYISGRYLEKLGGGDVHAVFRDEALKAEYYENLADYVSSLTILVAPNKIVFGGSVARSLDTMLLHKMVEERFPHFRIHLNIEYEKDTSRLSNIRGLVELYEKFRKKMVKE